MSRRKGYQQLFMRLIWQNYQISNWKSVSNLTKLIKLRLSLNRRYWKRSTKKRERTPRQFINRKQSYIKIGLQSRFRSSNSLQLQEPRREPSDPPLLKLKCAVQYRKALIAITPQARSPSNSIAAISGWVLRSRWVRIRCRSWASVLRKHSRSRRGITLRWTMRRQRFEYIKCEIPVKN